MKSNEILRKIKKAGWYQVRQTGSHVILAHNDYKYTISLPSHGAKEMATGTAQKLLKQAGIK